MADKKVKNITVPVALKYAMLPGIIPRIVELWRSGFATIAALMAQIFFNVGLLPVGHTYLSAQNFGRFGIFNVIFAAKENLVFSRKHLDQIIIFGLISFSIFLIFAQILSFVFAVIMPGAFAHIFETQNPSNDIAFVLMDRIFGVPVTTGSGVMGFFGSCVGDMSTPCSSMRYDGTNSTTATIEVPPIFPWAFHHALHQLFAFFSYTIAAVGLFILLYFIVAIILESIQSGTPFGKRFAKGWAPLRLIAALGLIIPISNGLNLAQYGVLYSAKWGSSLATNVWQQFNVEASTSGLINANSMVGTPMAKDAMDLVGFMHLVNVCEQVEPKIFPRRGMANEFYKEVSLYLINPNNNSRKPYFTTMSNETSYMDANAFFNGGDMILRWGSVDPGEYTLMQLNGQPKPKKLYSGEYAAGVFPYCGEIVIPAVNASSPGAELFRKKMYEIITDLWSLQSLYSPPTCDNTTFRNIITTDGSGNLVSVPGNSAITTFGGDLSISSRAFIHARLNSTATPAPMPQFLDSSGLYKQSISTFKENGAIVLRDHLNCIIEAAVKLERDNIGTNNQNVVPQPLLDRGWAGAGIWYNRIAEINGGLISAVNGMPEIKSWPVTMQRVAKIRAQNDPSAITADLFNPNFGAFTQGAILPRHGELAVARLYYDIYKQWLEDGAGTGGRNSSGNTFEATLAWIFGIDGLYSMTKNTDENIHPLAKLSGLGKSLIEGSIRNLTIGAGGMLADLVSGADNPLSGMGDFAGAIGSALVTAAGITMTAGFILFYVVPMLPFMYFFFAVGTWVKTVFEAMVGVPLWALAHLHIEGGGLPGQKAANGYYLLFEIFVRPIMIVMGFIASITIFSAMANVLVDIWEVVIANVGGATIAEQNTVTFADNIRGPVDKMFYLVMFTMLLYMIGVSSFKLVDQIPQSILRWVGGSVPTFVDQKEDITSSMVSRTAMAANQIFNQFTGGITQKYKQTNAAQDQAALAKYGHMKDSEVPDHIARIRLKHPEMAKSIEQRSAQQELSKWAEPLAKGDSVPQNIKDLVERFPSVAKAVKESYKE